MESANLARCRVGGTQSPPLIVLDGVEVFCPLPRIEVRVAHPIAKTCTPLSPVPRKALGASAQHQLISCRPRHEHPLNFQKGIRFKFRLRPTGTEFGHAYSADGATHVHSFPQRRWPTAHSVSKAKPRKLGNSGKTRSPTENVAYALSPSTPLSLRPRFDPLLAAFPPCSPATSVLPQVG